jgi:predicted regulator of amino acid metabolism with ACT domain
MNPAGDPNIMAFGDEEILPRVREALRAEDYDGFWYSGVTTVDGVDGWGPTSVEPRKQHVYSTLANMVGFLYETPSGSHRLVDNGTRVVAIPDEERYTHQVRGQYIGQRELIRFAAERGDELVNVVAKARADAIARGNDDSDDDQIPLEYEQVERYKMDFWRRVGGGRGGGADTQYELVNAPVFTKWAPTRTTTRPWGYLIPNSLTKIVPLLLDHGISVKQLTEEVELEVEAYTATEITHAEYFQAHYLKAVEAEKETKTITMPAGSFFIPSGQPMSNFISYIFEPETNDNLITWGFLDNVLRVTPTEAELEAQRAQMEAMLAGMSEEDRAQYGARIERQMAQGARPQEIPMYRVMKKTNLPGVLIQNINQYDRNRYIKY